MSDRFEENAHLCWAEIAEVRFGSMIEMLTRAFRWYEEHAKNDFRIAMWLNHGHPIGALYGNDGEMQCSICALDFKRMPIEFLMNEIRKFTVKECGDRYEAETLAMTLADKGTCETCIDKGKCKTQKMGDAIREKRGHRHDLPVLFGCNQHRRIVEAK
jgi:hypothetical protein